MKRIIEYGIASDENTDLTIIARSDVVHSNSDQSTMPHAAEAIMTILYLKRKGGANYIEYCPFPGNSVIYLNISVIKKTTTSSNKYEYVPHG